MTISTIINLMIIKKMVNDHQNVDVHLHYHFFDDADGEGLVPLSLIAEVIHFNVPLRLFLSRYSTTSVCHLSISRKTNSSIHRKAASFSFAFLPRFFGGI